MAFLILKDMSNLPEHQEHQNDTFYAVDLVSKQSSDDIRLANIDRFLEYYTNVSKGLVIVPAPVSILNHLTVSKILEDNKYWMYSC